MAQPAHTQRPHAAHPEGVSSQRFTFFTALADYHRYEWSDADLVVELEHFQEGREGGVTAEIRFTVGPDRLYRGRVNLLSATSKASLVKALSSLLTADWAGLLEEITERSLDRWRQGEPVVSLDEVEPITAFQWLLEPYLETGQSSILYADGDQGKSTLALAMAVGLCAGRAICGLPHVEPGPVLYLDWEDNPQTLRLRRDAIMRGHDIPRLEAPILYKRMTTSLAAASHELAKLVKKEGIKLVIVDSLGLARGGDPKEAKDTLPLFAAARLLGVAWIGIDHVAKGALDSEEANPYGSIYTRNLARQLWHLTRVQEPGSETATLLLKSRKQNHLGRLESVAYRLHYTNEKGRLHSLKFEWIDPRDAPELRENLSFSERILLALRGGASSVQDLAEELGVSRTSIDPTLHRLVSSGKVVRLGRGTYGLTHRGEA